MTDPTTHADGVREALRSMQDGTGVRTTAPPPPRQPEQAAATGTGLEPAVQQALADMQAATGIRTTTERNPA